MGEPIGPLFEKAINYFTSERCSDFSTQGNEGRCLKADSQTMGVLRLLATGNKVTIKDIRVFIRSENPKARLSEAREWLNERGVTMNSEWRTKGKARYLAYWLDARGCMVVKAAYVAMGKQKA
jgi:hypothetical protein